MNLANPGVGDVFDRLTILALKILTGEQQGQDVQRFRVEQATLLERIPHLPRNWAKIATVLDLGAVNAQIWQSQDELRRWRVQESKVGGKHTADVVEIRDLAFRLQELNDRRAQLVDRINNAGKEPE